MKYIFAGLFYSCLLGIWFDYTIWTSRKFDGAISYHLIPDTRELNMIKPNSIGAVISFHLTEEGIYYRVPVVGEFSVFPLYKRYYSSQVPSTIEHSN